MVSLLKWFSNVQMYMFEILYTIVCHYLFISTYTKYTIKHILKKAKIIYCQLKQNGCKANIIYCQLKQKGCKAKIIYCQLKQKGCKAKIIYCQLKEKGCKAKIIYCQLKQRVARPRLYTAN